MKQVMLRLAAAALAAGACVAAHAFNRSLYISPATMSPWPVYRPDILNPLLLSPTVDSTFRVGFMFPMDYAPNTTAQLKIHYQASPETPGSPCSIVLGVKYLDRTRSGLAPYETSPPSLDGMTNGNVTVVTPKTGSPTLVAVRSFNISKPLNAPFTGQKPGDGILIWFQRVKSNPLDTCTVMTIWHAELRYDSVP